MGKFILKRISTFIPMVLVMSFLIYGGIELAPGDAIVLRIQPTSEEAFTIDYQLVEE